jgi:hypothetical protein
MKIKLPLRVETDPNIDTRIFDSSGDDEPIGIFNDPETAQLFADCFEAVLQSLKITDSVDAFNFREHVKDLLKRAAEAVEG